MEDNNSHKSALNEKDGIPDPKSSDASAISKIKKRRRIQPSAEALIKGILQGNITALSQAITLVESKNLKHLKKATTIIESCLPKANRSIRIGITGVPGVGKSTFIEAFGKTPH